MIKVRRVISEKGGFEPVSVASKDNTSHTLHTTDPVTNRTSFVILSCSI